jgi:ABC-type glycerol-3-phosphate transport system substrate-binding protein
MTTKFQRIVALFLAVCTMMGCFMLTAYAADPSSDTAGNGSVTSNAIADAKELLDAISYAEYLALYGNDTAYPSGAESIVIKGVDYYAEKTTAEVKTETYGGVESLFTPEGGEVTWKVNVPKTAKYAIKINYWPLEEKPAAIQREFKINGSVPFVEAYYITLPRVWENVYTEGYQLESGETRYFDSDFLGNEIRPPMVSNPEWCEYSLKDVDGFYKDCFEFVFEEGENTITLEGISQPMAIASIELYPYEAPVSYDEYIKKYENQPNGTGKIKLEAELPYKLSTNTVYPVEDRTSAITSPVDPSCTLLNTIGGEKWQTSGQWVSYQFTVDASGMYEITARYKQDINDGMYSSRVLYLFSDESVAEGDLGYYNGIPFDEARELRFNYSSDWQSSALQYGKSVVNEDGESEVQPCDTKFYFKEGVTYTMRLEVSLGSMGEVISEIEKSLNVINNAYLNIIKLTGSNPDEYRDYYFSEIMPDTIINIILQGEKLKGIADTLASLSGETGSNVATLQKIARLLEKMGSDEDEIAKNLETLKTYIGSLGTWLSDAKSQPLQLDYIVIQSPDEELPEADAGFFASLWHELKSFFWSFFRDYNNMGASEENISGNDTIEVWIATGRDQSQVLRNLINNDFTPKTGIPVDLKLVAANTLLPSILAGSGPDTYLGLSDSDVINYAIRGALAPIENFDGFDTFVEENFNEAAMMVLGIADAQEQMHYYGLPETQTFPMMFIRTDILANLGIEKLDTWGDLLSAATILSQNNMTIGLSNDYKIFLYQMGSELFADGGMRINLDSNLALDSFETMCDMFTQYSFPYKFDFANRFRTGEMPIGIAPYNATYNQLIVFATELRGLWEFVPLPGCEYVDADGQTKINFDSVSTVSATVLINSNDSNIDEVHKKAWEFMKWYSGDQCQIDYSNEMVAILGGSAKHATANKKAFYYMPWTAKEANSLFTQFENLASIPNYPGAYIISRYTQFSFLSAYNDKLDPTDDLLGYIPIINKEISRKRQEFGLETLEVGETLASKRRYMILAALGAIDETDLSRADKERYTSLVTLISDSDKTKYDAQIKALMKALEDMPSYKAYCEDEYIDALRAAGAALKAANPEVFADICKYIDTCADSLKSYQASYPAPKKG